MTLFEKLSDYGATISFTTEFYHVYYIIVRKWENATLSFSCRNKLTKYIGLKCIILQTHFTTK